MNNNQLNKEKMIKYWITRLIIGITFILFEILLSINVLNINIPKAINIAIVIMGIMITLLSLLNLYVTQFWEEGTKDGNKHIKNKYESIRKKKK